MKWIDYMFHSGMSCNHSECNVASSLAADCSTLKLLQNFTHGGSESAEEL